MAETMSAATVVSSSVSKSAPPGPMCARSSVCASPIAADTSSLGRSVKSRSTVAATLFSRSSSSVVGRSSPARNCSEPRAADGSLNAPHETALVVDVVVGAGAVTARSRRRSPRPRSRIGPGSSSRSRSRSRKLESPQGEPTKYTVPPECTLKRLVNALLSWPSAVDSSIPPHMMSPVGNPSDEGGGAHSDWATTKPAVCPALFNCDSYSPSSAASTACTSDGSEM